jgi:uncharacterized protein
MKRIFLVLFVLLAAVAVRAQSPDALLASLAKPVTYVNDYAGIFPATNKAALEGFLQEVQAKTTAEIAVVALKSLDGGDINDFATRLFEKWGIGKKGKDNGILLIAAIEDRKVRIEVGYGLEGLIPDAKAGRLLDENVIPLFKEGNYAGGLANGACAIATLIVQDAGVTLTNAGPAQVQAAAPVEVQPPALPGAIAFFIFIGFIVLLGVAVKKGWVKPTYGGGSSGGGRSGGSSGGGGGGFGGGSSGGGGASRGW